MEFNINSNYYGFKLEKTEGISEIDSKCYVFYHEKSGAKLFYAKNEDNNKVFFVGFKTPPEDDCGTPHILEHSVLCGSKKYPAKDPFNELMKSSLNTYLNAMTYSDKTVYPVASCNHEDFKNLTDVYLDAVFSPVVLEEEKIFMQEGHSFRLENESDPITINGVVYNEMKGAMSSPERVLNNAINRSMFEKSIYKYESGGDPEAIPELTYEKFKEFYGKYYHPSNSFFYLYGDLNIHEYLKKIDEEYLSNYNKQAEIIIEEESVVPVNSVFEDYFSVPVGSKKENEDMMALNYIVGKSTDMLLPLSFDILNYCILETNASPLKRAVLDKKIGENIEGWFDSSTYDMVFSIVLKNTKKENLEEFKNVVNNTLEQIVKDGIDKKLIESGINYYEFILREGDFGGRPKGLVYGLEMMKGWLHGTSPIEAIKINDYLAEIREKAENGYFESIIKNLILNNEKRSIAIAMPEEGKEEKTEKNLEVKLENYKKSLSKEEINLLIEKTKVFNEYQEKEDSQEIIEKVPVLKLSDVDKKAKMDKFEERENIVFMPQNTNGIIYTRAMFSMNNIPTHLVPYGGLLAKVLCKLTTKNYSFSQLPVEINSYTGGVSSKIETFATKEGFEPVLTIRGKALERNSEKLSEILKEIISFTNYEDKTSIEKILLDLKGDFERFFNSNGHLTAVKRCSAMMDYYGYFNEITTGIEFNDVILKALKNIDETALKLEEVKNLLFRKENVKYVVSCEEQQFEICKNVINVIEENISETKNEPVKIEFENGLTSEAIETGDKIVYNALMANYKDKGFVFDGSMNVIKNIINTEFLWNEVRVKGGAYGCGFNILKNGKLYFYSYRDPKVKETYEIYNKVPKLLREISLSERDITKYTLGAINTIDKPKSKVEKIDTMLMRYYLEITEAELQLDRDKMLSVTKNNIIDFANLIEKTIENSFTCTFGSELKIKENMSLFEKTRRLRSN